MKTSVFPAAAAAVLAATTAQAALKISTGPTANVSCVAGLCQAVAKNAVLNADELAGLLAGGDVTVSSGSAAKDIVLTAPVSWTGTQKLTIDAFRSLTLDGLIAVAGRGSLTLTTNDGGSGGELRLMRKGRVRFSDNKGKLTIDGAPYKLVGNIKQIVKAANGSGVHVALARSFDAKGVDYTSPLIGLFDGVFEGLGNTISHLSMPQGPDAPKGLFTAIKDTSVVRDLGLVDGRLFYFGTTFAGLLAGHNAGTVQDCYASGEATANEPALLLGGLAGLSTGLLLRTHADVALTGAKTSAGGLAGGNSGTIVESYAAGTVTMSQGGIAGGLVGWNTGGTIKDDYARNSLSSTDNSLLGGLIGRNVNSDTQTSTTATSYAAGHVSTGTGGVIGTDESMSNADDYWDLDTSGVSDPTRGASIPASDPGLTGLHTAEFKQALPANFDPAIWREKTGVNDGYPHLIDNPPR